MELSETIQKQASIPDPANFAPVIDLNGLSVTFGGRPILQNLQGELRGRSIGLLGPNGAGKTTLIHTLLGFHLPSSGTAHIFGQDIFTDAKQIRSFITGYRQGYRLYASHEEPRRRSSTRLCTRHGHSYHFHQSDVLHPS